MLIESLNQNRGYDADDYLRRYIAFMTTPGNHRDTYIEECHRNFFSNYAKGVPPRRCGAVEKHIGGLVGIVPILVFYSGHPDKARAAALEHLALTHPGEKMQAAGSLVADLLLDVLAGTPQTVSAQSEGREILQTVSAESPFPSIASSFPLPWSAYVRLLSVKNDNVRRFYETEALRGGWSVRQLDRQINSQFYERTALSRNKAAMLSKGEKALPEDRVNPSEEIKDPFVLEFLDLKDEYSETDLEEALIRHLEAFLLELGSDFCFIGRQKRLRIGDEWYRMDLLFFHRRLRCLVIIDLKIGKFTHVDAGQMHLYLNYAREHWVRPLTRGDEPPSHQRADKYDLLKLAADPKYP